MSISRRLVESIPLPARGAAHQNAAPRGWIRDWYYVIDEPRKAGIPSVAFGVWFVSNPRTRPIGEISRGQVRFTSCRRPRRARLGGISRFRIAERGETWTYRGGS